jgi:hypothetical protein
MMRSRPACLVLACALLGSCGYQPIYGVDRARMWCVIAVAPKAADFAAVDAALQGARLELARGGALSRGTAHPCLNVELLRIDETATGIRAMASSAGEQPLGRGSVVSVVGRAWVEEIQNGPVSRDTGDMTRSARGAAVPTEVVDAGRNRALILSAARSLGRALARRALGLPEPSGDMP